MNPERLFETYLREYLTSDRGIMRGGLEDELPRLYAEWADRPAAELGGKSPRAYLREISDPRLLMSFAEEGVLRGGEPSPLALDRIAELPASVPMLTDLLNGDGDERIRILAAELLARLNRLPLRQSAELVFDPSTPAALREALVDQLKYADGAGDVLLERVGTAEGEGKKILAELLVGAGVTDDRTFALLLDLLEDPGCLPFAAQLLAEYGDPRAIERLSELAETSDYADYIELRNAVEMLGGELTLRFNWDGDGTYKKIKGEE